MNPSAGAFAHLFTGKIPSSMISLCLQGVRRLQLWCTNSQAIFCLLEIIFMRTNRSVICAFIPHSMSYPELLKYGLVFDSESNRPSKKQKTGTATLSFLPLQFSPKQVLISMICLSSRIIGRYIGRSRFCKGLRNRTSAFKNTVHKKIIR